MTAEGPDALRQFHRAMALEDALSVGLGLLLGAVEAGVIASLPEGFVDRLRQARGPGAAGAVLDELGGGEAFAFERQRVIDRLGRVDEAADASLTRVAVDERDGALYVRGHFESMTHVDRFFAAVAAPDIAARLAELELTAEDIGANGTRSFDLQPLLADDRAYPRLRRLSLPRTQPADHNRTIVTWGDFYEEKGGLGALLDRAPALASLQAGSAPSAPFFERPDHPLEALVVSAGYDHQGFVRGLAASRCFARLRTVEFVDYAETYMDGWSEQCTPRDDLWALFGSTGLPSLRRLTLVGTALDASECDTLLATPLGRQLESLELRSGSV